MGIRSRLVGAEALRFDAEVFTNEARRAGEVGDIATREVLASRAVDLWDSYRCELVFERHGIRA